MEDSKTSNLDELDERMMLQLSQELGNNASENCSDPSLLLI